VFLIRLIPQLALALLLAGCATHPDQRSASRCPAPTETIAAIQGREAKSPKLGQTVTTSGVVTAAITGADGRPAGVFIEAPAAQRDADPLTAEGVFVVTDGNFSVGSLIAARGAVDEIVEGPSLLTALKPSEPPTLCGSAELPPPFRLTGPPPTWEALEGMRVVVESPLTITGNDELGRFGALRLAFGERLWIPTERHRPGAEADALMRANARRAISIDDLSLQENLVALSWLGGAATRSMPLRPGDSVSAVAGVVDERFGYRLRSASRVTLTQSAPRPLKPPVVQGRLTVAGFNVLNLFNGDGQGSGFPTERGAESLAAYERQLSKILHALVALDADLYGLMELENDGFGPQSAVAELTLRLNQRIGREVYDYVRVPAPKVGSDQITNGMLYRRDLLKPLGGAMAQVNGPFVYGSRPPLLQAFEEISTGEKFIVVVNHFKSKGGCADATRDGDRDQGDGQACFNQARVEAASALLEGLTMNPTGLDDQDVLLIGDFNAHRFEDPLVRFEQAGFFALSGSDPNRPTYSYVFRGEAGSLDHAIVSPTLAPQVRDFAVWHINADEPELFEYGEAGKAGRDGRDWYAPDAVRSSDHDPLLIGLDLSSKPILE
jgi:uncharacterized protein